jgi:hypothetical protein
MEREVAERVVRPSDVEEGRHDEREPLALEIGVAPGPADLGVGERHDAAEEAILAEAAQGAVAAEAGARILGEREGVHAEERRAVGLAFKHDAAGEHEVARSRCRACAVRLHPIASLVLPGSATLPVDLADHHREFPKLPFVVTPDGHFKLKATKKVKRCSTGKNSCCRSPCGRGLRPRSGAVMTPSAASAKLRTARASPGMHPMRLD